MTTRWQRGCIALTIVAILVAVSHFHTRPADAIIPSCTNFSFEFRPTSTLHTCDLTVDSSGQLEAELDWTSTIPIVTESLESGTLLPQATASAPVDVAYFQSHVSSTVTWEKDDHSVSSSSSNSVSSSVLKTITPDAGGPIEAEITWPQKSKAYSGSGYVDPSVPQDQDIVVSANGSIYIELTWPSSTLTYPVLQLIYGGTAVATSQELTGNRRSINYDVTNVGAFSSEETYTIRVSTAGSAASYNLSGSYPVSPRVNLELLDSSRDKIADSEQVTGVRKKTLSYPNALPTTYSFRLSTDEPVTVSLEENHWTYDFADITYRLISPDGTELDSVRSTSGAITMGYLTDEAGEYTFSLINNSSDLSAPNFSAPTSVTKIGEDSHTGSVSTNGLGSHAVDTDEAGYFSSTISWEQGAHMHSDTFSGSLAAQQTKSHSITSGTTGTVEAEIDWNPGTQNLVWNESVGTLQTWETTITASASGTLTSGLNWPRGTLGEVPPNLDLYLLDADGIQLESSESLTGTTESVSYHVTDLFHPDSRDYRLRVVSKGQASSFTLSAGVPVTADVDLELYDSANTKVAYSYSSSKPETLSGSNLAPGTYSLKVISKDFGAPYSGTISYPVLSFANVTLQLKDPSGEVIDSVDASSGEASFDTVVPSAGTYVLEVVNNSDDAIPEFTLDSLFPADPTTIALNLVTSAGESVESTVVRNPGSMWATLQPREYRLNFSIIFGAGSASLNWNFTASMPVDEAFYEIAQAVPEFGGVTVRSEADGSQTLLIAMTSQSSAAASAVWERLPLLVGSRFGASRFEMRPVQYSFRTLKDWYDAARHGVWQVPGVVFTDIDEEANKLAVGVQDLASQKGEVENQFALAGVPLEAVSLSQAEPQHEMSLTLQNYYRPVVGGLRIGWVDPFGSIYFCTLGMVADHVEGIVSTRGFTTNSHCSISPDLVDGTEYDQPIRTWPPSFLEPRTLKIGKETIDPPYFTCLGDYQCRYADINFSQSGCEAFGCNASSSLGLVAAANGSEPPVWDGQTFYKIVTKATPAVGDGFIRVGSTTGARSGSVTRICVYVTVANSNPKRARACQVLVSIQTKPGDSGAPVFRRIDSTKPYDVALMGIHWGTTVFSPQGNFDLQYEIPGLRFCHPSVANC